MLNKKYASQYVHAIVVKNIPIVHGLAKEKN